MKFRCVVPFVAALLSVSGLVHAQEKFTYLTNWYAQAEHGDRKSTRLNSSHLRLSRMPSSA